MFKVISKITSVVFHPLLIVTWMTMLIYFTNSYLFIGIDFGNINPIIPVFLYTFLFPAIAILMLRKLDFIDSLEMPDPKQRIIPLIITIILYLWTFMLFKNKNFPILLRIFMMGTLASLFISFVINVFHKLSLHMVGISGALIAILLLTMVSSTDISLIFLLMIIITGLVATARLYTKAHTLREVYTGFLVGIFGQMIGLMLVHQ
ncbi:MAG: hypothetical protein U0U67_05495 [Chitinophagales bacterium]